MAYWVHRETDGKLFSNAVSFDPPAPEKDLNGLYKIHYIEFDGQTFIFSSIYQFNIFIDVLSKKVLPRSRDLAAERTDKHGPNSHWLSRLPAKVKSFRFRKKLIKYLISVKNYIFTGV